MPAIAVPAKVLVTGANGFIAAWIVRILLERGYSVRGTVRAESKATYLRRLLEDEVKKGKLEFVVVPDMIIPGAFDDAVKDIDAIVHAASPAHLKADDPSELIEPAVKGTLGILQSALKYGGPQLKRVIVVSSTGAVINTPYTGTFDENSWDEGQIAEVREKGKETSQMGKYRASKTLAEKAVWSFVADNVSALSWDLVTTCPPYVFGPILSDARTPAEFGTSMFLFYEGVFSDSKSREELAKWQSEWVDVRDLADAHVRALEIPEAGGQRFLLSKEPCVWQDWRDAVQSIRLPGVDAPVGAPIISRDSQYKLRFNSSKARTLPGVEFRYSRAETVKDIVDDFKARGVVP